MKMTIAKWMVLGASALVVAVGTPACTDDDDDPKPDTGTGGTDAGGSGGGGAGGSGGSGGTADAGPCPADSAVVQATFKAGVAGACMATDAGTGMAPTQADCDAVAQCALDACATEVTTCEDSCNCVSVLNCAAASGCVDQTSCTAAISTHPDECGDLITWFVAGGQAESQAGLDCVTAAAASCAAAGMDGGAMDGGGSDGGMMDSGSDASMMDGGDGG